MAFSDTLDYSPLNQPVTNAEIKSYQEYIARSKPGSKHSLSSDAVFFIVAAVIAIPFLNSAIFNGGVSSIFGLLPAAVIYAVFKLIQKQKIASVKLYKFAVRNNLSFQAGIGNSDFSGIVFNQGHSRKITQMIKLQDGSEIGNYQYSQNSGRNQTDYSWGFARVPLVRNLPNMLLDAKANNILGKLSNLPFEMRSNRVLELEGDFNKYFSLHVPEGYEQDALYVFTPDVMQALIDKGAKYDIEIIDNYAVFYRQQVFSLDSEAELREIFGALEVMTNELRDQTKRYSDNRVATSAADNIVAPSGTRLKTGTLRPNIIMIGVVLFIALYTVAGWGITALVWNNFK